MFTYIYKMVHIYEKKKIKSRGEMSHRKGGKKYLQKKKKNIALLP